MTTTVLHSVEHIQTAIIMTAVLHESIRLESNASEYINSIECALLSCFKLDAEKSSLESNERTSGHTKNHPNISKWTNNGSFTNSLTTIVSPNLCMLMFKAFVLHVPLVLVSNISISLIHVRIRSIYSLLTCRTCPNGLAFLQPDLLIKKSLMLSRFLKQYCAHNHHPFAS